MSKRGPYYKEKDRTPLAEYLVTIRIEQGLTQDEIAKKLKKSRSSISRIERGERQKQCLRGYLLYQLTNAYGDSLGEVLKRAGWPQLLLIGASEEERKLIIQELKEIM